MSAPDGLLRLLASCYNKSVPDDTQRDSVETTIPGREEQRGSREEATIGRTQVDAEIQDLEQRMGKAERWMILLTAAIALFALCSVVVGIFQWMAMRGQLEEMHGSSGDTHALAVAAGKQADAAKAQSGQAEAQTEKMAESLKKTDKLIEKAARQAQATNRLAEEAKIQAQASVASSKASESAAKTAHDALVLGNRPWLKVQHQIISALTFNDQHWSGNSHLALRSSIENVGQSVALNVLLWEDIFPMGTLPSYMDAVVFRDQGCNNMQHPSPGLSGSILFPKEQPLVEEHHVGPSRSTIDRVLKGDRLKSGKIGFALVGCVSYRASFEPANELPHQTRFIYLLGHITGDGNTIFATQAPTGTMDNLQLIYIPDQTTAY